MLKIQSSGLVTLGGQSQSSTDTGVETQSDDLSALLPLLLGGGDSEGGGTGIEALLPLLLSSGSDSDSSSGSDLSILLPLLLGGGDSSGLMGLLGGDSGLSSLLG